MARINLLPWREWERERKRKEFFTNLIGVALLGGAIILGATLFLNASIDHQNNRNRFLEDRIADLNEKIKDIAELRKEREELLSRMRVIQDLQGNRPVIVRVFDELTRSLADGTHYETISKKANIITTAGIAESNNRISALMRNIDASEWFNDPNLKSIKEELESGDYGAQASSFDLTFMQVNPNATEEGN
jgi:type IV pilus assembly protein PilN